MSEHGLRLESAPWRELWDNRLRRSATLTVAIVAFAVGFHLVFMDHISWFDLGLLIAVAELGVLLAGDPRRDVVPPTTLRWMRHTGQRLFAFGAIATVVSTAQFLQWTPPVATPRLIANVVLFGLGGLAFVGGMSLWYWSSPRIRGSYRQAKPRPALKGVFAAGMVLAAIYESIARVQRTGIVEPMRVLGLALVIVGLALAVLNPPAWIAEPQALASPAGDEH